MENVGLKSTESGKNVLEDISLFVSSKTKLKLAQEVKGTRAFNSPSFSIQHRIGYVPLFLNYASGIFRNESPFFYTEMSSDISMSGNLDGDKIYYNVAAGAGDAPPFRFTSFIFYDPAT